MNANERNGWRDEWISRRHRKWGRNNPGLDLDFVMLEYNYAKPCAIVEYKHKKAAEVDPTHANYRALVDLADNYKPKPLPCFVVRYCSDSVTFLVIPLNEAARAHYRLVKNEWLSEEVFVKSLFFLRKNALNDHDKTVIDNLKHQENTTTHTNHAQLYQAV